jgi:hypothetical protein
MNGKGVGARIAWSIKSKQVLADLVRVFEEAVIERLDFEMGEEVNLCVLDSYAHAKQDAKLVNQHFSNRDELAAAVNDLLALKVRSQQFLLFLQDTERRGVYRTTRSAVQTHAVDVLNYDGSCVYFSSPDCTEGFLLDYDADAPDREQYEMEYWLI